MGFAAAFLVLVNGIALFMVRSAVPGMGSLRITLVSAALALVCNIPWLLLGMLGWEGITLYGAATPLVWSVSIAWNVSVTVLMFGFPVWMAVLWALKRGTLQVQPDLRRRALLQRAGALVPLGALGFGTSGVAASGFKPFVRKLTLHYPDLDPALDGFKVGQFSDVHVGPFVSPGQVTAGIAALNAEAVHLVVMTGDLLDDNRMMPALNLAFAGNTAPYGLLGILGNHEYYAGLDEYLRYVQQGPMKLLVDTGAVIVHNGARVHVSGVDYPFRGMDGPSEAGEESMKQAMATALPTDFKLCLAHHPTCWDQARRHGAHLTLSGHTHGGQVAVGGRSVFRRLFRYMLGLYEDGNQRLFVTGGLGHWFPFRLGCPPEVVVVELRRGTA